MKVLKVYFLALLIVVFLPLTAQDKAEGESGDAAVEKESTESTEEAKEEKTEAAEDKKEASSEEKEKETAEAEEKTAEAKEKKPEEAEQKEAKAETKPVKEEKKAEAKPEKKEEAVADATLKIEDEEDGKDAEDEDAKDSKKFSVSVTNGFTHGVAKERKSFSYALSIGASYQLPWKIGMNAGVGLAAVYRYDLESAVPVEDGSQSTEKVDQGVFDGTPLNIGFSRAFPLFWDIGSSIGINVSLPFTSTELWEQYNIYTMLSANVGVRRAFKVAKETSITFGLGFSYTKTFAKEDYAWDEYQDTVLSPIQEHTMVPSARLSFKYKDFGLAVGGTFNIGRFYSSDQYEYPDGTPSYTEYQGWHYSFSFRASANYSIKSWNLALGVMTNAPEKESGGYVGYDSVEGDPEVKDPSQNYPFKGKYTRVFANIGYSYSF